MRRVVVVALAALFGLVVGGFSMLAFQAPAGVREGPGLAPGDGPRDAFDASRPASMGDDEVLLAWTAGGLPAGLEQAVEELPAVQRVTRVDGDLVDLVRSRSADGRPVDGPPDGWAIPLDALAIDAAEYAGFLPKGDHVQVAALRPGEALLSETSADVRGLESGDTVTFAGGAELTIRGVVADTLVGAAEVVVTRGDAAAVGIDTERFLLVVHNGERAALEQAIRRVTDEEVRVRAPGETPYLRHGDAVLPQALLKASFGEFAYRRLDDGLTIEQDPDWVAANITTTEVLHLGRVRCHRNLVEPLESAMAELRDRGLAHLVDPEQYAGCHSPRLIGPDAGLSRHAWGLAVDLNADDNPYGEASVQDRRVVEVMADWGFTWGGFWLVPDAMHFEYVGRPHLPAAKVVRP